MNGTDPIQPGDSAIVFDLTGAVHLAVPCPKAQYNPGIPHAAYIAAAVYILMGEDKEWLAKVMQRSKKAMEDIGPDGTTEQLIEYTTACYSNLQTNERLFDDGEQEFIYNPDIASLIEPPDDGGTFN